LDELLQMKDYLLSEERQSLYIVSCNTYAFSVKMSVPEFF